MRRMLLLLAATFLVTAIHASDSHAAVMYKDVFGPWLYEGPTTTKCVAYRTQNQRCRDCVEVYDMETGQPTGRTVCGYVARNAACNCTGTDTCKPAAECTYQS